MTELKEKLDEADQAWRNGPEAEEFYDLIDLMGAWETMASFEPEKMNSIEKVMMVWVFYLRIWNERWMSFRVVGRANCPGQLLLYDHLF